MTHIHINPTLKAAEQKKKKTTTHDRTRGYYYVSTKCILEQLQQAACELSQVHSLIHRELCSSFRFVLGGLLEAALTRGSPVRPLVPRSALTLAALVLEAGLALLVWSPAHPPDT